MLDFIFATGCLPPFRQKTGGHRADITYHFPILPAHENHSFTSALNVFGDSLVCLSQIHGTEVIPTLNKVGSRRTWIQKGTTKVGHRGFDHAPKSLLCIQAVQKWKHNMLYRFSDASDIIKLPLHTDPTIVPCVVLDSSLPAYPIPFSVKAWTQARVNQAQNARKANLLSATASESNPGSTHTFGNALFRDAG